MSDIDRFPLVEGQLKALGGSSVRTKILLHLKDEAMSSGILANRINARSSTVLHAVKDMIKDDLLIKNQNGFSLTNLGKIQAILLSDLIKTILALDQHREFWLTHDLRDIPTDLLKRIGVLYQAVILKDPMELQRSHDLHLSELVKSKEVFGLSPIILPEYPEMISALVKNGVKFNLILTKSVLEGVAMEHGTLLPEIMAMNNFKLYCLDDDVRIAFTVMDSLLSLGLFRLGGGYDAGVNLNCYNEEARTWGKELFEHFRRKARRIL